MALLVLCSRGAALARRSGTVVAGGSPAQLSEMADKLAHDEMKKENIAGLSLAFVVDKKLVVSRACDLADVQNHAPASTATLFRTGSIAKPITAAAAMGLYQQGKLDLDAQVQKYCLEFPKKKWAVKTRELLGHLSGIRHYRNDDSDFFGTKDYAHVSDGFEVFADHSPLFQASHPDTVLHLRL